MLIPTSTISSDIRCSHTESHTSTPLNPSPAKITEIAHSGFLQPDEPRQRLRTSIAVGSSVWHATSFACGESCRAAGDGSGEGCSAGAGVEGQVEAISAVEALCGASDVRTCEASAAVSTRASGMNACLIIACDACSLVKKGGLPRSECGVQLLFTDVVSARKVCEEAPAEELVGSGGLRIFSDEPLLQQGSSSICSGRDGQSTGPADQGKL